MRVQDARELASLVKRNGRGFGYVSKVT